MSILCDVAGLTIKIDQSDLHVLKKFNWHRHISSKGRIYIRATINGKRVGLHRYLLEVSDPNIWVDHKNGCSLDYTRDNLRVCTPHQNNYNRRKISGTVSKYKGVTFTRDANRKKPWQVSIKYDGKQKFIGYFANEEDAAIAYDKAAIEYHGEFACLNFDRNNYVH